ncbi:unnamed protein product [Agarophyton chilense]
MAAFVPSLPFYKTQHRTPQIESVSSNGPGFINYPRRLLAAPRLVCVQQKDAPSPKSRLPHLKKQLFSQLDGFNRGLDVDPDSDTMTSEEADVEETIEALEDDFPAQLPTKDSRMHGRWRLAYTSSAITRYFGGVSGLQRLLPNATVGTIIQLIDPEDGTSTFKENITFELPVIGNKVTLNIQVQGRLRATNEERQIWEPENVKCGVLSWFADNWKTFRAFQVTDVTYLDDELRITRGQTGGVAVFERITEDDEEEA